jgi:thiamine kinase-like enzyme
MCVVHGDYKPDNLLLPPLAQAGSRVGVVDFQYAGIGYGAVDLAYFLCVGVSIDQLSPTLQPPPPSPTPSPTPPPTTTTPGQFPHECGISGCAGAGAGAGVEITSGEEKLLRHYHQQHNTNWHEHHANAAATANDDQPLEWDRLLMQYELSLLDWVRFMSG